MRLGARIRRAVFSLRPEEFVTLLFFVLTAVALARMSATRADALDGPAAAYPGALARLLLLLAATAFFAWILRAKPRWTLLRDSMPFVFCANIYASLHDLIRFFHAPDITAALYRWDVALFGSEPTVWAERFVHPWLTDAFTVCYWLFYVLGPLMGLLLYLRGNRAVFRHTMVTIVFCLYLGYVGYVAWPASAPRLFIPEAYSIHLHGSPILDTTRDSMAVVPLTAHGAFPSIHCAVALLALILAWRYLHWFFWVQLPFAVGLIVGTVYLRHHWVVDILAGFVLTFVAYVLGTAVERWWARRAEIHAPRAKPAEPAQGMEPAPGLRAGAMRS
jgi:membrane-associated phospholipid phosphatase